MYKRVSGGYEILWRPESLAMAKQAMAYVLEVDPSSLSESEFVLVTDAQAQAIQDKYADLVGEVDA